MINLLRNETEFWYALYKQTDITYDAYGNETGDPKKVYETPVKMTAVISPATGWSNTEQFGNLDSYDKVLVIDDMSCPIDENTVLFIDKQPETRSTLGSIVGTTSTTSSGIGAITTDVGTTATTGSEIGTVDASSINSSVDLIYDYVVRRVAKSQNLISIAVQKVRTT